MDSHQISEIIIFVKLFFVNYPNSARIMMEIKDFFIPVNIDRDVCPANITPDSWVKSIAVNDTKFPQLENKKIALIGLVSAQYPNEANNIRGFLYSLKRKEYAQIVADLGNFEFKDNNPKTFEKFGFVLSELHARNLVPVIFGGKQEITYSQYLAYEYLKKLANFVMIDPMIDFFPDNMSIINAYNYLYKILLRDPTYLFNMSHVGFQTYLTDGEIMNTMEKYYFDLIRIGKLKENMMEIEPIIRSADILSFDLSAIRHSDAPASNIPSPNGFSSEEACMITRFAGLSDNLNSIGFYEYNSEADNNGQTAFLVAQMIWYFVDGFLQRKFESIIGKPENFTKFITSDTKNDYNITFYKSIKTNRWWMEVPLKTNEKKLSGKQIIPCSYQDYEDATRGVLPERWLKGLRKFGV